MLNVVGYSPILGFCILLLRSHLLIASRVIDGSFRARSYSPSHSKEDRPYDPEHDHHTHWNYGMGIWYGDYPDCKGSKQSPINIETSVASFRNSTVIGMVNQISGVTHYRPLGDLRIVNNGYTEQVSGPFGEMLLPDGIYQALHVRYHFPSEHVVNGKHFAGELQILHHNDKFGPRRGLSVVAILLDDEDFHEPPEARERELAFHRLLGFGSDSLPKHDEDVALNGLVDLNAFSEQLSGPFYHYEGSLTTPPCSEGVHWYVMKRHAAVTKDMVQSFKAHFPDPANNRPVQPLKGREVVFSSLTLPGEFPSRSSAPEPRFAFVALAMLILTVTQHR